MVASLTVPPAEIERVGVVGAGIMGAGIAQVAAQAGFPVVMYDIEPRFVERGQQAIAGSVDRGVARGRLTAPDRDALLQRLDGTTELDRLATCQLVIEAVPEDLRLKLDVFQRLSAACPPETLLVSNTSSLSVTEIGRGSGRPERVLGMHFFNPPPAMRLVEVVRSELAEDGAVERTLEVARAMGKTPVVCLDTPGFIVNRVARPYYLESLRAFGDGLAPVPTIDAALRSAGFPMGPFELMDLIGLDTNFAVTSSVYEQRFGEGRFRPHLVQQRLVRAGHQGRKTGSGFYDYAADPPRVAVAPIGASGAEAPGPWDRWHKIAPGGDAWIVARVLSAIINEAYFALGEGVATAEDIDTAMRLGTNYPSGPFAWGDKIGLDLVLDTLLRLEDWYRDGRFAPAPRLRARAAGPSASRSRAGRLRESGAARRQMARGSAGSRQPAAGASRCRPGPPRPW
jgi:3-hydroxybutyryl-CoA dehydrogenase